MPIITQIGQAAARAFGWTIGGRPQLTYTFSTNTANASLSLSGLSGYIAGKSDITVTVNSGIYVYATSTGNYGLSLTGSLTTGDTLNLVNNGYIIGQGGSGTQTLYSGSTPSYVQGGAGGPALNLGWTGGPSSISITNNSYVAGGGGAGSYRCGIYGGGGGGAGGGNGGYAPNFSTQTLGVGGGAGQKGTAGKTLSGICCVTTLHGGCGGGAGGGGGAGWNGCNSGGAAGGGGGRILPGCGGPGGAASPYGAPGGPGGSSNNVGSVGSGSNPAGGSGGGGWGAAAGNVAYTGQAGGAGGKSINLSGHTITYITTGTVWGSVS